DRFKLKRLVIQSSIALKVCFEFRVLVIRPTRVAKTQTLFWKAGLRQLDVSLLSQLCSLNQSIQEFRAMILQEDADELPPSRPPSETSNDDQQSCSSA
ncbi:Hypothetical predicted protein, partial [Cloeon dipterum]